ncbi:DUF421 domain-containing protein [Salsuginibacillus kocurii]|uniref:DUF421 domain-containing protein n=1 Tax=Salsuginibacillus kocurii TaxID=427078 RepID=UPI0003627EE1|nr:DUF421 domain-containing protein [Salsuginibacillus kocurii]
MTELEHVFIRGAAGFILLFIIARVMGKKHIVDMTYLEYIVGIAIGSIAAELTFGTEVRASNFIFGMVIWALFPILLSKAEKKSLRLRKFTEGEPTLLIEDGKVLEENLGKEDLTVDELMTHLRQKDVFKLSEVESAILEKSGQLSVLKKSDLQPVTPKDMNQAVDMEHNPQIVVIDGNVLSNSLETFGYTEDWLLGEVMKQGANDFKDVFMAQIDSLGNVYVDLYDDEKQAHPVKQKIITAASIKQLQSKLMEHSVQSQDEKAKEMYEDHVKQLERMLNDLTAYVNE